MRSAVTSKPTAASRRRGGVRFMPNGWHTVTPRLVVKNPKRLVAFLRQVFDAKGEYREGAPTEIRLGDSILMISAAGVRNSTQAFLYVYVKDTDETYRRALDAGAMSVEEPSDMQYGDRRCMVEDEWGNTWQVATRLTAPAERLKARDAGGALSAPKRRRLKSRGAY